MKAAYVIAGSILMASQVLAAGVKPKTPSVTVTATSSPSVTASPTPLVTAVIRKTRTPTARERSQGLRNADEIFEALIAVQENQAWLDAKVERLDRDGQGPPRESSGRLRVARGGKARLEIEKPELQSAISDGKALWVVLPDAKQAMKYDAAQMRASGNFFLDLGSSLEHYAEASVKRIFEPGPGFDESRVQGVELMPRAGAEAGFERLRAWVDTRAWQILKISLSLGGIETEVNFSQIKTGVGKDAPPKMVSFKYKAPKDYQVFDMSGNGAP